MRRKLRGRTREAIIEDSWLYNFISISRANKEKDKTNRIGTKNKKR